jgi:DNA-binding NtrC family response regulator
MEAIIIGINQNWMWLGPLMSVDKNGILWKDVQEVKKAGDRAAYLNGYLLAFSRKQVLQPVIMSLNVRDMDRMLRRIIGEDIELRTILHLTRAAEIIGIGLRTLQRKLKEYDRETVLKLKRKGNR